MRDRDAAGLAFIDHHVVAGSRHAILACARIKPIIGYAPITSGRVDPGDRGQQSPVFEKLESQPRAQENYPARISFWTRDRSCGAVGGFSLS